MNTNDELVASILEKLTTATVNFLAAIEALKQRNDELERRVYQLEQSQPNVPKYMR